MNEKPNLDLKLELPSMPSGRPTNEIKKQYFRDLKEFAERMKAFQRRLGSSEDDKVSARGWCYILEGYHVIDKSEFDLAEKCINKCRKEGLLPLDFVLHDKSREFENLEDIQVDTTKPEKYISDRVWWLLKGWEYREDVAYWENQEYYLQMMVEKIDIKNMFKRICGDYHIPINNAKGWSDMLSRADLIERFQEAESIGLKPVLLYYADFDPAGLLIADNLKKNLRDLQKATKWNPDNLIVDVFGLSYEFIEKHNLTWIDNLMTGGGKVINKKKQYVKEYIEKYGERKVEANAVLIIKDIAIKHCEKVIQKYLGENPEEKFKEGVEKIQQDTKNILDTLGITEKASQWYEEIKSIREYRKTLEGLEDSEIEEKIADKIQEILEDRKESNQDDDYQRDRTGGRYK